VGGGSEGGSTGSVGVGGASACGPGLATCPDGCVDLDNDIANCGMCGHVCPTELCLNGVCVGGPAGHTVVLGMTYATASAATERILGNAVFLTTSQHVRILDFRAFAEGTTVANTTAIIASEAIARGRTHDIQVESSPAALGQALNILDHDVLFIHDQPALTPAQAIALNDAAGAAMTSFVHSGGTIVVLAASAAMADLLTATSLLDTTGFVSITGDMVVKLAPTDAVSLGVPAPLLAKEETVFIVTSETPSPTMSFVFGDDSSAANPVVVHRVFDLL